MSLPLLIDVTRLLDRALQGRWPTGVDRVGLEYVRSFRARAAALVRFAGRWLVLDDGDAQRLFDWLLEPEAKEAWSIRRRIGRAYVLNWRDPKRGSVLLNVVHSGLDRADYTARVREYGLRPLYFLHDLIPLHYPEYGAQGSTSGTNAG